MVSARSNAVVLVLTSVGPLLIGLTMRVEISCGWLLLSPPDAWVA